MNYSKELFLESLVAVISEGTLVMTEGPNDYIMLQDMEKKVYQKMKKALKKNAPGIKSLEYQEPGEPLYGGYGGIAVNWKNKTQAMKSIEAAMKIAKVKELDDIDIRRNPGI
jgi:hypothetical protein